MRRANRQRWANQGIKVGSINIAGLSYFKLFLLLEVHNFDVLCLQETWLVGEHIEPFDIPGYSIYEQRREKGTRGGIAILVRKAFPIHSYKGNEYAQQVQLGLPDGQKATISNVYLPPHDSLRRRHIEVDAAKGQVEEVLSAAPATDFILTCGDFNARTGTKAPRVRDIQLSRVSQDSKVCNRASWFLHLCEITEQHILNGAEQQELAQFTCIRGSGCSTVDYILSQDPSHIVRYDADTLEGYTDHIVLYTSLAVAVQPPLASPTTTPATTTIYRWDVGTSTTEQLAGIAKWKEYTDTVEFKQGMADIV